MSSAAIGTVTVFGGSGFIGRHLVPMLIDAGATVRVAARRAGHEAQSSPSGDRLQVTSANILDDDSVVAAVAGADAVVNLVGILTEARPRQTYRAVHVDAARRVALAARHAGARRLVHFSALGASRSSPADSDRTKAEGEEAVRAAFPAAVLVRPSLVYGPDDHFFNGFAALAKRTPVLPLIGGGRTRFQPIHVEDVARAVTRVLQAPETAGRIYELGGARVYSFRELLEGLTEALGRRRMLLSIPFPLAELQAIILERLLSAPPLTRDQVWLLTTDKIVGSNEATLADLGLSASPLETFLAELKAKDR
jgi:NADH dehydrogenase